MRSVIVFLILSASVGVASNHVDQSDAIIRYNTIHHPVIGEYGMVASQRILASQVGAKILSEGGNAVDAAVATGMALAVVLPRAGNLGGGGFMLVHLAKENKTIAIDYREMAPALAHKDMYLDSNKEVDTHKERFSYQASGVPGTVAGMAYALKKYGTMSWSEVLQPAIKLAREGFVVSYDLSENLKSRQRWLTSNKATAAAYYKADKSAYNNGEILVLKDLANTLQVMADKGPQEFYSGSIADKIAADMKKNSGIMSKQDLENYRAIERQVVTTRYRGFAVASMPPPSSGGVHLAQMLNILERFNLKKMGYGSAESLHLLAETMKLAYSDRSKYLGDPDFYDVPVAGLTSKSYAKKLAGLISLKKATPSKKIHPNNPMPYESPSTTHYSVMDAQGNAVANTFTLNFSFGSGIVIAGTGILMNNEMADFSAKPGVPNAFGLLGGDANSVQPKKRPLSAMTPAIVFKKGRAFLVTGSPGGSRIITSVLQMIINVIDFDMNVAEATAAPRMHHQWLPDKLNLEPGFSPDSIAILKARGHKVRSGNTMGSLQSIMWKEGLFYGASDSRRPDAGTLAASKPLPAK